MAEDTSTDKTFKLTEQCLKDWDNDWKEGEIGFHREYVCKLLEKNKELLIGGGDNLKIFVPLCGKTLDMKWLSDLGHRVVGLEYVEDAVIQFFTEQSIEFTKHPVPNMNGDVFKSKDDKIHIYRCDLYDFNNTIESDFDAVWDRGSFVAINPCDRERYTNLIKSLASSKCRMFIAIFRYPPNIFPGPPHLIQLEDVTKFYGDAFNIDVVDETDEMADIWREQGLNEFVEVLLSLTPK